MRLHRFIVDLSAEDNGRTKITDPKMTKQIRAVLRLKEGDKLILSDGKGKEYEVVIKTMGQKEIVCEIVNIPVPARTTLAGLKTVHLYLAILKKENFELAVQKAVECGVSNIIPIITERTIKTGLNVPRLEKIILEASEQSGRSVVPALSPILNLKDALTYGGNASAPVEKKIIFHLNSPEYKADKNINELSIFVGPEGGFTENEIKLAKDAGFVVASLGSLTLRGETAAIIGTYRAVHGI